MTVMKNVFRKRMPHSSSESSLLNWAAASERIRGLPEFSGLDCQCAPSSCHAPFADILHPNSSMDDSGKW